MTADAVIEVIDALEAASVRTGITGGWGVDALLGRQTRPHVDVDIGVSADAVTKAVDALRRLDYDIDLDERPGRVGMAGPHGRVDLHPIAWAGDGTGRQIGLNGEVFQYPVGSLDARGEIGGRAVRCGTPELQLTFHEGYEPRAHDLIDMRLLAERFDLRLPHRYLERG